MMRMCLCICMHYDRFLDTDPVPYIDRSSLTEDLANTFALL
jgi:hypothetical protein